MTPWWVRWRLKSPVSRLFVYPFVQALIKENTKAPRQWPLWGESTGHRGTHKGPVTRKMFPSAILWNIFDEATCYANVCLHLRIVGKLTRFSPEENGCRFAGDIFKCNFMNESFCILIQIWLTFVPNSQRCFRQWVVAEYATTHYMNLNSLGSLTQICDAIGWVGGGVQHEQLPPYRRESFTPRQ